MITSARRQCGSAKLPSRPAMSTRRSRAQTASSRPNTNGRFSPMPAWDPPARSSISRASRLRVVDRFTEAAFHPRRRRRHSRSAAGEGARHLDSGSGLLRSRNDAGDAAMDAALLAKAVGKPVRLQYMRDQGTGWDPKGPASIHRARAAIDAAGKVIAYEFGSKAFPRVDVNSNESKPHDTLAGQLTGVALHSGDGFAVPEDSYGFANKRTYWETVSPLLDRGSPLRTSHLRDPIGPQVHFASESFMDEVAAALKLDPVAFRLQYVTDARDIAVIKAAAEKAGWQPRVSPRQDQSGSKVSGRGFAYVQRHPTRVAMVAEVEVDRSTGKIWVRRFTVAHDCGQIINPDGLRQVIEGGVVQAISRTLWEEVRFNTKNVTSVDWLTYPILDITEAPETIDIVLIDRPEIPPTGAGEPATRPVAAAIVNAVFDATGVRIRRAPLSPDNVKSALS